MRRHFLKYVPDVDRRRVIYATVTVLEFMLACSCIALSWYMLLVKSRKVRNFRRAELYALEALSLTFAAVAHTLLIRYAVTFRPSLTSLRLVSKCVAHLSGKWGPGDHLHDSGDDDKYADVPRDRLPKSAASQLSSVSNECGGDAMAGPACGKQLKNAAPVAFGHMWKELRGRRVALGKDRSSDGFPGGATPPVTACARHGTPVGVGRRGSDLQCRLLSLSIVCLLIGIHVIVHKTIIERHRQSQEIVLALARCSVDVALVVLITGWCVARVLRSRSSGSPRMQRIWNRVRIVSAASIVLLLVGLVTMVATQLWSIDPLPHLRMCILDDHECDPCAAEGMQLNPMLRWSWVWPALIPRRLFSFYSGSERCGSANWKPIAYLDEANETLVVSATCADGTKPHIYLHHPENNELHGRSDFYIVEVVAGNKQYHRDLESFYGTAEKAEAKGVTVRRDPKNHVILSVELTPSTLRAVERDARTEAEEQARRSWPSRQVLEIRLGESASYMVRCPGMGYEEFYMFPMTSHYQARPSSESAHTAGEEPVSSTCGEAGVVDEDELAKSEPAGSVLLLVFDAVSRQAVRRSLPKFAAWMNDFHRRHRGGGRDGHIVVEPTAVTTVGLSTRGNFGPMLTGTTWVAQGVEEPVGADNMNESLFNLAKGKHGDLLHTAMTVGFCHDFMEIMIGNREPSSGYGGPLQGIDHYLYEPMCHLEFSGLQSNFQGPYSILKRCIDNRHVHEYMFDYTEYLLRRQLRQRAALAARRANGTACGAGRRSPGKFFFDISYFIDGHEGTHSAITLVDEHLVDFMNRLENELRFFDDPLNTLIFAADHGSHVGHYYEFTYAGGFERTSPAMLFVIHPEVLRRIDLRKGRIPGEAMTNFLTRTKRLMSPLDLYRTLGDLLGIDAALSEGYQRAKVAPVSLFDARSGPRIRECRDITSWREFYFCSPHYCVSKQDAEAAVAFVDDY